MVGHSQFTSFTRFLRINHSIRCFVGIDSDSCQNELAIATFAQVARVQLLPVAPIGIITTYFYKVSKRA